MHYSPYSDNVAIITYCLIGINEHDMQICRPTVQVMRSNSVLTFNSIIINYETLVYIFIFIIHFG